MGTGNWLCHSNSFFSVNEVHNGNCAMWERWTKLIKLFYQIMYKLCEGHDFTGFLCASSLLSLLFYHLLNVHMKCGPSLSLGFAWFSDKNPEHADVLCIGPSEQQCLIFKAPLLLYHLQETRRLCHQTTGSPVNMMQLLGSPRALLDGRRMHICGLGN
jgi:hypothetical protein